MRLVDGQQTHVHPLDAFDQDVGLQAFGRQVEKLVLAVHAVVEGHVDFAAAHPRKHRHGRNASPFEPFHLVLHQGDERGNDQADSLLRHGRHLEAQRLATARGEQGQRIVPGQHRPDDVFLEGTKSLIAPVVRQ